MDSGFRIWGITLAIYILFVAMLQVSIYLAVPKAGYYTCRGWRTTGPAGKERRYIDGYYLKRTSDGFKMATETDFIASIISPASNPLEICVADVNWYERDSLFDRLSMFSVSSITRNMEFFSAREGSRGEYTPIDPLENSIIRSRISGSESDPGFVQAGFFSITLPRIDPMILIFKLLVHSILIWYSYRLTPTAYKTIRWWLLPTPKKYSGKCVNCQYSTKGLTTPICPECGRYHGMEWSLLIE